MLSAVRTSTESMKVGEVWGIQTKHVTKHWSARSEQKSTSGSHPLNNCLVLLPLFPLPVRWIVDVERARQLQPSGGRPSPRAEVGEFFL